MSSHLVHAPPLSDVCAVFPGNGIPEELTPPTTWMRSDSIDDETSGTHNAMAPRLPLWHSDSLSLSRSSAGRRRHTATRNNAAFCHAAFQHSPSSYAHAEELHALVVLERRQPLRQHVSRHVLRADVLQGDRLGLDCSTAVSATLVVQCEMRPLTYRKVIGNYELM